MAVNINSIAKAAGVSTTTVSNFINCAETFPISAEKRARIMEAMRSFNYRPNGASSQLRRKSVLPSKLVFIFGANPCASPLRVVRNPMLGDLLMALDKEASSTLGLSMEVRSVADENSVESWNETIADAEAVVCYGRLDNSLFQLSSRRNIPLALVSEIGSVSCRGCEPGPGELDFVYWDAPSHLQKMLVHLRKKGAKRLAFVSSWNIKRNNEKGFSVEAEAKISLFKEFVSSIPGVSGEVVSPPRPPDTNIYYESRNAYEFLRSVEGLEDFDAIAGHNDYVAQGVVYALQEKGLALGRDVLVCGEGDYAEIRHSKPAVTTVSYDKSLLASKLCSVLKRRLKDNRPLGERILIPSSLILRETA